MATAKTVRTPHLLSENKPLSEWERGWGEGRLANQNVLTVRLTARVILNKNRQPARRLKSGEPMLQSPLSRTQAVSVNVWNLIGMTI